MSLCVCVHVVDCWNAYIMTWSPVWTFVREFASWHKSPLSNCNICSLIWKKKNHFPPWAAASYFLIRKLNKKHKLIQRGQTHICDRRTRKLTNSKTDSLLTSFCQRATWINPALINCPYDTEVNGTFKNEVASSQRFNFQGSRVQSTEWP